MLLQFSHKRLRDRALFERWDQLDSRLFDRIPRERLHEAQAQLLGHIVLPGDPEYDEDRKLFNPVFDSYPDLIVYCAVDGDIAIALRLAQDSTVPFTVRSGGHCTAGFSAGRGLLIDVSNLDDVCIDANARVATVGTGCTFAKLNSALAHYDLHVPGGECPDVCIGGYVQGGGYGFTSVTFGMNCDNVIDMRVMLADGRIVVASKTLNADLWWAMRGGTGGNFGVLLTVRYRLRLLGDVFGWALIWPLQTDHDFENATGALMALQSGYMLDKLRQALNIQVSLCWQPGIGLETIHAARPFLMVRGLYVGTQADGEKAIQPLCELPGAITQWTRMDSFNDLNVRLLDYPFSMPWFGAEQATMPCEDKASRYVTRALDEREWRGLLDYFVSSPNPYSYFYMEFYGGAINSPAEYDNAFVHRRAAFNAVLDVLWFNEGEREPCERFLNGWIEYMAPMWNGEIYQNYPRLGQSDYGACYWGEAQGSLDRVKRKYDPQAAFTFAQQVCPPLSSPHGPVIPGPSWLPQAIEQPIDYGQSAVNR
ncbi:FAD-binding oxidoreductase [Rhizobacter sp. Root1221]|uniref:FAD-dependent oxidoreductase n=1 Tax=Rhizobacter sp. Root1221 TaxID=1736433 RepID=UPI000701EF16|nr:FAD-binding oxidoreductase [Rhizobacter sp. Root1221]KQW02828.1 hypothetical protein ASC87_00260 [Rhizobacter sp. Root1221]